MDKRIKLFQRIRQLFRGEILLDEPLSEHTTYKIGGPADYFLYPKDLEDLMAITEFCHREGIQRFVIGKGSNILVADAGFRGIVIDLSRTFTQLTNKQNMIVAGSGVLLWDMLKYCTERGLSGFEPLMGIPGQLGGCLMINAGAFGVEIGDRLQSLRMLDGLGALEKRQRDEIQMGYRYTDLPGDAIIIEAQFSFKEGNPMEMEMMQNQFLKRRRDKQPLSLPSAGSVFKRPKGDYAGRLIEETGCKGLRIGDAMVSKKHANFIVNTQFASAEDVRRVIYEVGERVLQRFGVELELEIHLIGFDS